ncbi:MAG TPA: LptF/LptG family permease [Thermodesulfovibrionales bacterium]|nr:LptF/LptG family permease [Thermodesulfovibrionales bacterium]
MKTLYRYYITEFLKILGILTLGLGLIFSLLDLVDKIDDFVPKKLSIVKVAEYVVLSFPKYLYYLLPMSLLICSLFVFSHASRHKEIIAVKAMGGRAKRLFSPFVIAGLIFSGLSFFIGEIVVPDFSDRILEFKKENMKKIGKVSFNEGTIWLRTANNSLVRIGLYVPDQRIAKGVSIFELDGDKLRRRIEAGEASWKVDEHGKGLWKLSGVTTYDVAGGKITRSAEMNFPYLESPDFFSSAMKKPDEMGIVDLYRYAEKLKASGFRDAKLGVDIQARLSYPLANLFMLVLGLSLSLIGRSGGGLFAAGLGISICFIYWLAYTFMLSMGYARVVPAVVATWVIPSISGAVAMYLFNRIPE